MNNIYIYIYIYIYSYIATWSATLDKFVKVVAFFYKIKLKGYFSLQYNSYALLKKRGYNMNYTHINYEERVLIEHYFNLNYSINKIAKEINRSPSTISRELKETWIVE